MAVAKTAIKKAFPRLLSMSDHADGDAIVAWTPPTYNTERPPTLLESRYLLEDVNFPGNFARSAKWFIGTHREFYGVD